MLGRKSGFWCRFWLLLTAVLFCAALFPIPAMAQDDAYDPLQPDKLDVSHLTAKAAILINAKTGDVLFEKDADAVKYPASTTKILTVLLGVVLGDMEQTVYLSDADMYGIGEDDATMGLEVGESINFKDLLFGTFIRSANEGANLIAETIGGGSIQTFVDMMNDAAVTMCGCTSTHFVNPNGLHDESHVTTARDMAKIAMVAMQNEQFREIARSYTYSLPASNLHRARVLTHSSRRWFNPSLEDNDAYYAYATGIKSGFHSAAGNCFVGSAERDGIELISVVFDTSQDGRWSDSTKLMEYGFSQFVSMTPQQLYQENPIVLETSGFSLDDSGYGRLELGIRARSSSLPVYIVATKDEVYSMARNLRQTVLIEYTRDFAAPINQGEVMGTMTYYPTDGSSPVVYDLYATRTILRRENAPLTLEEIEQLVAEDPNPFPPFGPDLALLMLIPASVLAGMGYLIFRKMRRGKKEPKQKKNRVPEPKMRFYQ